MASPCHSLLATAKEMNIPVIVTTRGDGWACGSATFNTLWPPKDLRTKNRNHASLAFEILVHGRRLRFSGDADSKSIISEIQTSPQPMSSNCPTMGTLPRPRNHPEKKTTAVAPAIQQPSSCPRAWNTWPGSPHLATGLDGGICIQVDSCGGMTAAAQNRFYTWPPEP